jgi:hypothetical protein
LPGLPLSPGLPFCRASLPLALLASSSLLLLLLDKEEVPLLLEDGESPEDVSVPPEAVSLPEVVGDTELGLWPAGPLMATGD